MKKIFTCIFTLIACSSFAQNVTPVTWTWKAEPITKGEYKLVFTGKIDAKWHTYSQFIGEGGPVATSVNYDAKNKDFQLIDKSAEAGGKVYDEHDEVFDMQLKYFEDAIIITQKIKVFKDTKLSGFLEYMACDNHQCLPPNQTNFEFELKASAPTTKK